jgi:hypothetical protein
MASRAGLWAAVGSGAFNTAMTVAARRTPGYVVRDQPISSLAAHGSPAAPVMISGFLGLAAGQLGLAAALRDSPVTPEPLPTMLMLTGLTTAAGGLARNSHPDCPTPGLDQGIPETTDYLHMAFSGATFALWMAAPFVAATRSPDAAFRRRSAVIGVTTVALFGVLGARARRPDQPGGGWAQRAFVASALSWQSAAAAADRRARA